MRQTIKKSLVFKISIIILFAIILSTFRIMWIDTFLDTNHPEVTYGELDLRDWDFSDNGSVTLDGDWNIYPRQLIEHVSPNMTNEDAKQINVPGDWSDILNPDDNSPYGYASYHLRVLVDADEARTFSIRIPSARSASALYVNGRLIGETGIVGKTADQSKSWNIPYSSTSILTDESGVIDIVLQVSNFADPRTSGLVRSVKFGFEKDIAAETELSSTLQLITGVVLFAFALCAALIYFVGLRDKRLIFFAIVILSVMFINLSAGDEKTIYQFIQIDYILSLKLSIIAFLNLIWALVHCVAPQIQSFSKKFLPIYSIIHLITILITLILPMKYFSASTFIVFTLLLIASIIIITTLLYSKKNLQGGIWVSLALVAITNNFMWWAYIMVAGIKVAYYPFDLIISIICLAGVWFNHYNQMHVETKELAIKLQKADKVKDEFLANTSHELLNPLHGILNISQGILEREHATLQKKSIKNLETVLSVSRRMSFMLNELLDITNLEDGNPKITLQAISPQAVTEGVIDMLDFMVKGKPIKITNCIPTKFPLVTADENRIVQIIFNLLHNAIKFTPQGVIEISAFSKEDTAYIEVIDTGIGMDNEALRTIFEPYIQGASGEGMIEGGFGLGLNISKKLIELHGGTLSVTSILGKGSSFTFSLPLADPQEEDEIMVEKLIASTSAMEAPTIDQNQLAVNEKRIEDSSDFPRVLVVDDDPVNLEVIETILSPEQYAITTVLSAENALNLIDKQEWDLVISDVMMPKMSGYELTRIIRKRFSMSELPILLLTAKHRLEDIESGFLSGANDYVTKPVDAVELRLRVNVLTEVRESMREWLRMESAWLHAQIKPHFLFNTLNSIFALSEIDIERMQKLLEAFTNVLRSKFNFKNLDQLVPLKSELSSIEDYLYIQKVRFGDRLKIKWKVNKDIQIKIPSLSIQPLVENSIEHGLMKRISGGEITIQITTTDKHVKIVVEDNGVGIDSTVLKRIFDKEISSNSGVGLLNTNLRLKRLYGKGLTITSTPGSGTRIFFLVPIN